MAGVGGQEFDEAGHVFGAARAFVVGGCDQLCAAFVGECALEEVGVFDVGG
nr:hypothetical protein [Nocardia paucivorans]